MGVVWVACCAARVGIVPYVNKTSTLRRSSSPTRLGRRSSWPSLVRYSIERFCPSTYPRSRRVSSKSLYSAPNRLSVGGTGIGVK